MRTRIWLSLAALLMVVACGEDDPTGPDPDAALNQVATTLANVFVQRDYESYESLLHTEFEFQFPDDELDLAGTADGRWDRTRDLSTVRAMLSGEPNKDGRVIQDIEFQLTPQDPSWSTEVEPEFEGSLRRTYTVQMDVEVSGNLTYQVRGEQEFYIQQVEVDGQQLWKLRFWRDLGVNLAKRSTEENSFGAVKASW